MQQDELMSLKETGHKGDFLLPFVACKTVMPDFYTTFPMHWHEETELMYVEDGEFEVTINFTSYRVRKGDIVVINPCLLHSFRQIDDFSVSFRSVIFDMSILTGNVTDACSIKYFTPFLDNVFISPYVITPMSKGYDEIKKILEDLLKTYDEKKECYEMELKSLLFRFFYLLVKNVLRQNEKNIDINDSTSKNVKVILDYIRENYMNPITIDELADSVNLSKHYFMRFFKKYMGVTCVEYINDYRLNIAANQLLTTREQITDISVSIGITNLSYFNRIFKKKFHMTPKEYRSSFYLKQTH